MFTVNFFAQYSIMDQMDRTCTLCGKTFRDPAALKRHSTKKLPCAIKLEPSTDAKHPCPNCNRDFTTETAKYRHIRNNCHVVRAAGNTAIAIEQLAAKVQSLERQLHAQSEANPTVIHTVNNVANTTVNTVNTVTISPWGAPLQLTDADVEAALATVPGLAGTPALPEVVAALMELVKRAHAPPAARNVHLNPKRTDQALALTPGGWAALPLEEATAALFDGASASMSAARMPSVRQMMRTTIPVQYRAERAASVQLGLRPMGAHLLNVAPGGPGPLLLTGPAAPAVPAGMGAGMAAGAASAGGPQPAETTCDTFDATRASELLKNHPAVAGVTAEWLARVTTAAGISAMGLARALRQASMTGLCGMAEWQGILRLQRDSCQAPAAATRD